MNILSKIVVPQFTLRVTPAMAASVTDRLWTIADLTALVEDAEPQPTKRGPYKKHVAA
jgi:hypothetical protein